MSDKKKTSDDEENGGLDEFPTHFSASAVCGRLAHKKCAENLQDNLKRLRKAAFVRLSQANAYPVTLPLGSDHGANFLIKQELTKLGFIVTEASARGIQSVYNVDVPATLRQRMMLEAYKSVTGQNGEKKDPYKGLSQQKRIQVEQYNRRVNGIRPSGVRKNR